MNPIEKFLEGMPDHDILRGMQALLPSLKSCWGDLEAFLKAALPVYLAEIGLEKEMAGPAKTYLEKTLRQVARLHATQFRVAPTKDDLEVLYQRLVPTATDSPTRQGYLWLAFQIHDATLSHFDSEAGKREIFQLTKAIEDNRQLFHGLLADAEKLSLTMVDKMLITFARKVLGAEAENFLYAGAAGILIEKIRIESRKPPRQDVLSEELADQSNESRRLSSLVEPVRAAELNEAHQRFLRMNDKDKTGRFGALRKMLNKLIKQVSVYAPLGFEKFCQGLESKLFPYPAQLEWMRSYLKPIYTNASQSSIYDNCVTETAINQRYQKLVEEKTSNPIMLELSKSIAMAKLNTSSNAEELKFLEELDLKAEFDWPVSFEELKARQSS